MKLTIIVTSLLIFTSSLQSEMIEIGVAKSSISITDSQYYNVRLGTVTYASFNLPDGTTYTMPVFVNAPAFKVAYKVKWKGYLSWSEKSGSYWVVKRDTNTIVGIREDGVLIHRPIK